MSNLEKNNSPPKKLSLLRGKTKDVLIIAVLCLVCAKKNKELSEDKDTEEKEKEAIGG